MDPVTLIVTALAVGAALGLEDSASAAVKGRVLDAESSGETQVRRSPGCRTSARQA